MSTELAKQLNDTIAQLSIALQEAKAAVAAVDSEDLGLRERIVSYEGILTKQRELVKSLISAMNRQNWDEVNRLAELVRASSLLIRVDAGFLVEALRSPESARREEFQA